MMITPKKDPMGAAIADFHRQRKAARLRVFSPDFDEDEIPVATLFRTLEEMPTLEQQALQMARGRILDVGAGAGCHSLCLQEIGRTVTAIDISPLAVETMTARGVHDARQQDFWSVEERYDTLLMLMNGIGIVGSLNELPHFFHHLQQLLADGGQLLLDSSDICYLFEDEEGIIELPGGAYFGELEYQMQYKSIKGDAFPWLYIDFETLADSAATHGFAAELIQMGNHYDYLARIVKQGK